MSTEYRIHRTNAELDALLYSTGGEVTPEVEALEHKLAHDVAAAAEVGAEMVKSAKAEAKKCDNRIREIQSRKKVERAREERGRHLLRLVADITCESSFAAGVNRVTLSAPKPSVAMVEGFEPDWPAMVADGLARTEHKPDKTAIAAALASDQEVEGFYLHTPDERKVTVR